VVVERDPKLNHSSAKLGVVSIIGEDVYGVQAGVANWVSRDLVGVQASVANWIGQDLTGLQAGVVNVVLDEASGLQASVVNYATNSGFAQAGVVNVTGTARGLQLGVVNVAVENEGIPIGLVSVVLKGGQTHAQAWYDEMGLINLALIHGTQTVSISIQQRLTVDLKMWQQVWGWEFISPYNSCS